MTRWRCTWPTCARSRRNLAGNAALSVPCGLAPEDGLPVGLQIMAPVLADDRVYRVAAAVEAALDRGAAARCWTRRPAWTGPRRTGR